MTDEAHPAAVEAGYAPLSDYVSKFTPVDIAADIYEDFEKYAIKTHCTPQTAINAALNEWLGRV